MNECGNCLNVEIEEAEKNKENHQATTLDKERKNIQKGGTREEGIGEWCV